MNDLLLRRGAPVPLLLLATLGACGGKTVVLGTGWPLPYHFHVPAPVTELASPSRTDNPTLTGDLLEIYLRRVRPPGGPKVSWVISDNIPRSKGIFRDRSGPAATWMAMHPNISRCAPSI